MSEESMRLIKFDGNETNWYQWSVKTVALPCQVQGIANDVLEELNYNPYSDDEYKAETDKGVRAIYEANDKAYQLLIMNCTRIAFGIVNQAKTKKLIDSYADMAWKNLEARYAPHSVSDLVQFSSEFNKCIHNANYWYSHHKNPLVKCDHPN